MSLSPLLFNRVTFLCLWWSLFHGVTYNILQCSCPTCGTEKRHTSEDMKDIVAHIRTLTEISPEIGVICGSGLGGLGEDLDPDKEKVVIPYSEIPKFPQTTGEISCFVLFVCLFC